MNKFIAAVKANKYKSVKKLIKNVDVKSKDSHGVTPIFYATNNSNKDMVELLIEHGADINEIIRDTSLLWLSVCHDNEDIARLLIENGANNVNTLCSGDNDYINISPLCVASRNGNTNIVKLLIHEAGADVNQKCSNGITALYTAAFFGHNGIVQIIINTGTIHNIDATNDVGCTALHASAQCGCIDIAKILIDHGADINIRTSAGASPLLLAAQNGYEDIVSLLISKHAIIDNTDIHGNTPLFFASKNNHLEIVKMLVKCGSNIMSENIQKTSTPLSIAIRMENLEVIDFLVETLRSQ